MDKKKRKEIYRKSIHISSILMPLMFRYVFHNNRKSAFVILIPLTLIALIIEIIRLENKSFKRIFFNIFGIMLRRHEIHDFTGATYLLISAVLCIAIFPVDITFLALSFLAIGDTLAAIIGISYGKRKLLGTKKSLEGSIACFVGTFLFAIFFVNPVLALFGALATTMSEFSRIPMDDNIKIPLTAGIVMSAVNMFI